MVANGIDAKHRLTSVSSKTFDKKSSTNRVQKTKKEEKFDEEDDEEEYLPDVGFMRVLKMNKPEWPYMLCTCLLLVCSLFFASLSLLSLLSKLRC